MRLSTRFLENALVSYTEVSGTEGAWVTEEFDADGVKLSSRVSTSVEVEIAQGGPNMRTITDLDVVDKPDGYARWVVSADPIYVQGEPTPTAFTVPAGSEFQVRLNAGLEDERTLDVVFTQNHIWNTVQTNGVYTPFYTLPEFIPYSYEEDEYGTPQEVFPSNPLISALRTDTAEVDWPVKENSSFVVDLDYTTGLMQPRWGFPSSIKSVQFTNMVGSSVQLFGWVPDVTYVGTDTSHWELASVSPEGPAGPPGADGVSPVWQNGFEPLSSPKLYTDTADTDGTGLATFALPEGFFNVVYSVQVQVMGAAALPSAVTEFDTVHVSVQVDTASPVSVQLLVVGV